jgi:cytoskeletal protein CcmA (bactofilin family)
MGKGLSGRRLAMWGSKKNTCTSKINTLIGQHTTINGDISYSGGLHVEGEIKGNVVATSGVESVMILSETGVIEGDVRVPNMVLNGTIHGDVHAAQHLNLLANTRVNGNVYYSLVEMAGGAEVNGNLVHCREDAPVTEAQYDDFEITEAMKEEMPQVRNNS